MLQGWVLKLPKLLAGLLGQQVEESSAERGRGDDEHVPWVPVLISFSIVETQIATARLNDAGIPTHIRQEPAGPAIAGLTIGPLGQIEVLVPNPMVERAQVVLKDTLAGEIIDPPGATKQDITP